MIGAVLDNLREYWLVHLLLVGYTVLLAYHAWAGNRETKGLADYYVGGRSMGGVTIGLSFFATYSSTNSFIGFAGQTYEWGVPWLLFIPMAVAFSLFAWVGVAPRLRDFTEALDSLTVPDFIGFRFQSDKARVVSAIIVIFASFFYMTAVFKGIGNLLEVFLGIPYSLAIVLVFFIVVAYTVVGGFISVAKTDAVQGVVMILAAILLFSGVTRAAGGVGSVFELRNQPETAHLFTSDAAMPLALLLGIAFAGTIKFVVEPRQLSRFYALEGRSAIRTGAWVSTLSFAFVYAMLVPIGLYARRILPGGFADTDTIIPTLLTSGDVFSNGVSAFLLVALVAAAMSSLDSVLLVMAATAERDVVGVIREPSTEAGAIRATRFYVALFAFITMLIALRPPGGIVALTALSGALYGACFLPPVLLGLYWRRGNGTSVLAAIVTGIAVLMLWRTLPLSDAIHQVFPAVILSIAVYVGVSLVTPAIEDESVRALFER